MTVVEITIYHYHISIFIIEILISQFNWSLEVK